jgi:signal transduction histidine kinase
MARRSRSQAAVHEEARQRELFAALPNAVLVAALGGQITQANPAAGTLFDLKRRLTGLNVSDLLPFINAEPVSRGGALTWHGAVTTGAGRLADVEVVRTKLEVSNLPERYLYVVHDISALTELTRMREQLLYDVAHELRGPLGVLENALEILASEYGALTVAEFNRLVASGQRTAARLHDLMEDLLSAGSIQSGSFAVHPRPIAAQEILDEAKDVVEAPIAERRQVVQVDLPEPHVEVMADPRHATRLLTNLLTNASKYGPEGTPITVRAASVEGARRMVKFEVADKGPGISSEQQEGMFNRFYRVRAPTEEPGIGLGLAIAQGIVAAHGGEIGIESAPGVGTRVWFTLPAAAHQE